MKALGLTLLLLCFAFPAQAAGLALGKPGYGGPGCPAGTAAAQLGPGGKSLTVRFSRYRVSAGGSSGRTFDRKSCNLAIPLRVPAGLSVSIVAMDFHGYNALPKGANSQFSAEYFLAGTRGTTFTRNFAGPQQGAFQSIDTGQSSSWSACGASVILRTNSSLKVTTTRNVASSAAIDSQKVKTALVFRLLTRKC